MGSPDLGGSARLGGSWKEVPYHVPPNFIHRTGPCMPGNQNDHPRFPGTAEADVDDNGKDTKQEEKGKGKLRELSC